ncbi:hypothetical protein BC829DRAFT_393458, partial [Chytridium lagenaria]
MLPLAIMPSSTGASSSSQSPSLGHLFLLIGLITCSFHTASAGPVNNVNSFPYAQVNEVGSTLTVGDFKVIVKWLNSTTATSLDTPDAATKLVLRSSKIGTTDDVFTGGLASLDSAASATSSIAAVACSDAQTQIFVPRRSAAFPGGQWSINPGPTGVRRCAITTNSVVAELFTATGNLVLTSLVDGVVNQRSIALGTKFQYSTSFSARGSRIVIVGSKGSALISGIQTNDLSTAIAFPNLINPFTGLQANTRIRSNQRFILRADANGVEIASLVTGSPTSTALATGKTRLPISPCGDTEACAPSLSQADDSWSCGYWGNFLGVGTSSTTRRIVLPLGISTSYGVALGHQGLG